MCGRCGDETMEGGFGVRRSKHVRLLDRGIEEVINLKYVLCVGVVGV